MKKLFITIIALIAISLIKPAIADAQIVSQDSARLAPIDGAADVNLFDTRIKALENVFAKYNSILKSEAVHYVRYADEFGVDWRLLPAISGLESTFAKRMMPGSHNAYGWGGGYIYFETWEDGIRAINKSLAERYYARGANDVWSIGPIYAESPTWAVRVNIFMEQIEKEYMRLSVFSALPSI